MNPTNVALGNIRERVSVTEKRESPLEATSEGMPRRWRAVQHPHELTVTGLLVICEACGARRDWMILCFRNEVSIRCRCSHQWREHDITRAEFDSMIIEPGTDHQSLSSAISALGYDGTFAGTYLTTPYGR